MEFKFTTVVTHINTDEIYGLDFLKKNRCLVDVSSAKMYTGESEHELQLKGNFGCFIDSLKETVCLPPSSKMIFSDFLSLSEIMIVSMTTPLPDLPAFATPEKRVQCSIGTERTPKHLVTLCLCHQLESAQKWFEDPGELIYEPEFESGMTIRKKTSSSLPGVKRKAPEQTPDQKNVYHIKCEYRDNWTLRVALDSISLSLLQDTSYHK